MILSFWIWAILLSALASAFVLLPLVISARRTSLAREQVDDRAAMNLLIYQERSAELSASLAAGDLDPLAYEQLCLELQRSLLDESNRADQQSSVSTTVKADGTKVGLSPWLLGVLLPMFAIFAYADFGLSWGAIDDLQLAQTLRGSSSGAQSGASPHDTIGVNASVDELAERLQSQPDNDDGWFLLSQSYMRMGEFEKAAAAFEHLLERYPNDAGLSSWYTEALFLVDNRELTPRVSAAVERTLTLNPQDVSMLEIKAMNAFQNNYLSGSLNWFRQALRAGVDGERATLIQQAITRLEEDLSVLDTTNLPPIQASTSVAASNASSQSSANSEMAVQRSLQVLVEKSPTVNVDPEARVFVFARAMQGPPMPLAVQQMTVAALPQLVTLDESMGMMAGMSLANFDQIQVVARISSSGIANVSPTDYQAQSAAIDMTAQNGVISLTISRQVKDQ